jgi:hypothetical protein
VGVVGELLAALPLEGKKILVPVNGCDMDVLSRFNAQRDLVALAVGGFLDGGESALLSLGLIERG